MAGRKGSTAKQITELICVLLSVTPRVGFKLPVKAVLQAFKPFSDLKRSPFRRSVPRHSSGRSNSKR